MQDVIYVACDDSGAEAKGWILEYLDAHGYAWRDCGGDETPSRYPYYAAKVAAAVSRGEIRRGILICGSGIGMSIAANKFRGVRASVVTDDYSARLTRRHNDSNVLCLGGRMVGRWMLLRIVEIRARWTCWPKWKRPCCPEPCGARRKFRMNPLSGTRSRACNAQ